MKLFFLLYLATYSWSEVINIMLMCDMKTKKRLSQGVSLKKFTSVEHRNQTEEVKELVLLKGLIIVGIEMCTVKLCKSPVFSRWDDWQNIVIETEYGYEADEISQCLETYDVMRKTTESERETKDQIMVQINKYVRNGGRRYYRFFFLLSQFGFLEGSKIETEMLSVKMHQTKAISWNKVKSGEDVVTGKTTFEVTQLLKNVSEQLRKSSLMYMRKKVHQVRGGLFSRSSAKKNGKGNDELRSFAAKL